MAGVGGHFPPTPGDTNNGAQMRIPEGGDGQNTDITAGEGEILGVWGLVLPLGICLIENAQISFDDFIILTVSSV